MMHFSIVITIDLGSGFVLPVVSLETSASSWQVLWNSSHSFHQTEGKAADEQTEAR